MKSRRIIEFLDSVIYGGRTDPPALAVKGGIRAFSALYRAALRAYLLPFDLGLRRQQELDRPVISVGNLTVGGTGKTPTVQYLCRGLTVRDFHPAVLSYGYGGSLSGRLGVVSDGTQVILNPNEAGDEPVMLASSLPGIPVLVCNHRTASGRAAIRDFGADVLILDDGFQVWKLRRDLDIVLLNASRPFDNGRLLPAGRLREPPSALKRADCLILMGRSDESGEAETLSLIRRFAPDARVFCGKFVSSSLVSVADGSRVELQALRDKKVFALSSIADPCSFEETVAECGAVIVGHGRYPDHHLYSAGDIAHINREARGAGAELIVTTEKDAVKLVGRDFSMPVLALRIELELDDEAAFWQLVADRIGIPASDRRGSRVV